MATTPSAARRTTRTLVSALLAALALVGPAGAASAEAGYRFWNYFHLQDGAWTFADTGPSGFTPEDGAVEGYRFATTPSSDTDGRPPRADLGEVTFEAVCGAEDAADDQKRVAVVIDYGTEADAEGTTPPEPRAACAVVPADASGQQILESVADVRVENGLACAVDGHPAKGCGEPVADADAPATEQPVAFAMPGGAAEEEAAAGATAPAADPAAGAQDGGFPWAVVVIGLIAAAVAGGAVVLARRDRAA